MFKISFLTFLGLAINIFAAVGDDGLPVSRPKSIGVPMDRTGYYFLASLFNGTEVEKEYRHNLSQRIATLCLGNGISLFAPIVYNQALIKAFPAIELEERRKLLMPMNIVFFGSLRG